MGLMEALSNPELIPNSRHFPCIEVVESQKETIDKVKSTRILFDESTGEVSCLFVGLLPPVSALSLPDSFSQELLYLEAILMAFRPAFYESYI